MCCYRGGRHGPWRLLACYTFWFLLAVELIVEASGTIPANVTGSAPEGQMCREERIKLKNTAKDMFYHAYGAYMKHAYPADELMPLSCTGRFRGLSPPRGDIDDSLGNFSLTLIDSLDTLLILGDFQEFENAMKLVINDVSFDNNVIVSVFETNIRVLGGLLSAHVLATYLQRRDGLWPWYSGELLDMATDVGRRLLPAFNTSTGIPHARVNLKHGLQHDRLDMALETCTACAGSMILEMAALSRLTGDPTFEQKAQHSMDALWSMRHHTSNLMGTILNVHSGDWVRRDSGVGAGIDSYYEYCLKAYVLLDDDKYLKRFNRHYTAVMKYISQGPMLLDVQMHRPHSVSRNYMDALLAFWPGLQVLIGDLKPAVETHEMLYQVAKHHTFIPEAFTTDFQVHWPNHPLRPEFLESTYFLYTATSDPYYLHVGKTILESLQRYAKVPCGYAAINDVRTRKHEDRMDSFVLAETFKYLYLLFADPVEDLPFRLDEYIFTTEGHLLPVQLATQHSRKTNDNNHSNRTVMTDSGSERTAMEASWRTADASKVCPSTLELSPGALRRPLHGLVSGQCPRHDLNKTPFLTRISPLDFNIQNPSHLKIVNDMGITILNTKDGHYQLLHSISKAKSARDAEAGFQFMREMAEISKNLLLQQQQNDALIEATSVPLHTVSFTIHDSTQQQFTAGGSQFGRNLVVGDAPVTGYLATTQPKHACETLTTGGNEWVRDAIALIERGDCLFVEKARLAYAAGATAVIIYDVDPAPTPPTNGANVVPTVFTMSGDGTNDVPIPVVFLLADDASKLRDHMKRTPLLRVEIGAYNATTKPATMTKAQSRRDFFTLIDSQLSEELRVSSLTDLPRSNFGQMYARHVDDGIVVFFYDEDYQGLKQQQQQRRPLRIGHQLPQNHPDEWYEWRRNIVQTLVNSHPREIHLITYRNLHTLYKRFAHLDRDPESKRQASSEDETNADFSGAVSWLLREFNSEYLHSALLKLQEGHSSSTSSGDNTGGGGHSDREGHLVPDRTFYETVFDHVLASIKNQGYVKLKQILQLAVNTRDKLVVGDESVHSQQVVGITKEQGRKEEVSSSSKSRVDDEL